MIIVIDTNVLISGIFFSGAPHQVLRAWLDENIQVAISREILSEYQRVANIIASDHPGIDITKMLDFLIQKATLFDAPALLEQVCADPDDDKFLACALASSSKFIISGDKHLLTVSGNQGIEIVKPKAFLDYYLL